MSLGPLAVGGGGVTSGGGGGNGGCGCRRGVPTGTAVEVGEMIGFGGGPLGDGGKDMLFRTAAGGSWRGLENRGGCCCCFCCCNCCCCCVCCCGSEAGVGEVTSMSSFFSGVSMGDLSPGFWAVPILRVLGGR